MSAKHDDQDTGIPNANWCDEFGATNNTDQPAACNGLDDVQSSSYVQDTVTDPGYCNAFEKTPTGASGQADLVTPGWYLTNLDTDRVPLQTLSIQTYGGFNTLYGGALVLNVVVAVEDCVIWKDKPYCAMSLTEQMAMTVGVESVIQKAVLEWQYANLSVWGTDKYYNVEERTNFTGIEAGVLVYPVDEATNHIWSAIAEDRNTTSDGDHDCPDGYDASVFCLESMHVKEMTPFHDQRFGETRISCDVSAADGSWTQPAHGLFEVLACESRTGNWEADNCVVVGESDSNFKISEETSGLSSGETYPSTWMCGIDKTVAYNLTAPYPYGTVVVNLEGSAGVEASGSKHTPVRDLKSCRFHDRNWENHIDPSVLWNASESDQVGWDYKEGVSSSDFNWGSDQSAPGNKPREYRSHLRIRFPENWGNGVTYDCRMQVCSIDRDAGIDPNHNLNNYRSDDDCSVQEEFSVKLNSVSQEAAIVVSPTVTSDGVNVNYGDLDLTLLQDERYLGSGKAGIHVQRNATVDGGTYGSQKMTVNAGHGAQLYVKLEAGEFVPPDSIEARLFALNRTVALVIRSKTASPFCLFTGNFIGEAPDVDVDVGLNRVSRSVALERDSVVPLTSDALYNVTDEYLSGVKEELVLNMDCTSGDSGTAFVLAHGGPNGGEMGRAQYTGITFEASQVADDELEVCSVAFDAHDGTAGTRVRCTTIEVLVIPAIATEVARFAPRLTDEQRAKEIRQLTTFAGVTDESMNSLYYQKEWTNQKNDSSLQKDVVTTDGLHLQVSESQFFGEEGIKLRIDLEGEKDVPSVASLSVEATLRAPLGMYVSMSPREIQWGYDKPKTPQAITLNGEGGQNKRCDLPRQVKVDLIPGINSPSHAVASGKDSMTVDVMDDDSFGKLELYNLGYFNSSGEDEFTATTIKTDAEITRDSAWRGQAGGREAAALHSNMSLVLTRRYSDRDLDDPFKRLVLHPINVLVVVDAPAHVPSEYSVMVCSATVNANFSSVNHEVNHEVTMAEPSECEVLVQGSQSYVVELPEWGDKNVRQVKVVSMVAKKGIACKNGETPSVSMRVIGLQYEDGAPFNPAGCDRPETMAESMKAVKTVKLQPDDSTLKISHISDNQPYVVNFAGIESTTSADQYYFNGNKLAVKNHDATNFVAISERSYLPDGGAVCTRDGVCGGTKVEISLCHELRPEVCKLNATADDDDAQLCKTGYEHGIQTTEIDTSATARFEATTKVVFVDLEDSQHDYSKINDNYEISCPSFMDQLSVNNAIITDDTPCTIPSFDDATKDSESVDVVYCPVACYNVSSKTSGKAVECKMTVVNDVEVDTCADQPMRAMFVFRREDSNNDRVEMLCPGIFLTEDFTNIMENLEKTHAALVEARLLPLPKVVFKTKPDGLQSPTLDVKLRLVYGPDNEGKMGNCGFADQSSNTSRSISPFKIRNIESYNTVSDPTSDNKEDYRMRSAIPRYVREGSESGKIELKFTMPFASRSESRVITNVEVGECPRDEEGNLSMFSTKTIGSTPLQTMIVSTHSRISGVAACSTLRTWRVVHPPTRLYSNTGLRIPSAPQRGMIGKPPTNCSC